MRHSVVDKHCVDVLHVQETDEFVDSGIVADVALEFWIGLAPLFGSHAEHGDIENVCFLSIDNVGLLAKMAGTDI